MQISHIEKHMKRSLVSVALFTVVSVAACSSGTAKSALKSYDPCKLLTANDVKALFPGGKVEQTQHDTKANPVGIKICFYSASATDQKFAELAVTSAADAPPNLVDKGSLKPAYDNERQFLNAADLEDVPGLGDAAYYGGSGLKPGAGLHVLEDEHGVELNVIVGLGFGNDDKAAHLKMEKAIAQKVLSRL